MGGTVTVILEAPETNPGFVARRGGGHRQVQELGDLHARSCLHLAVLQA
jgi:hypothetical protein